MVRNRNLVWSSACRIVVGSQLPGESVVGIEIPNRKRENISFKEIVDSPDFVNTKMNIPIGIGKDIYGNIISTNAYAREAENKKGMDESQITGACSSYARKYALNGLFCIDDVKDSDFTNNGKSKENLKQEPSEDEECIFATLKAIDNLSDLNKYYAENKAKITNRDLFNKEYATKAKEIRNANNK